MKLLPLKQVHVQVAKERKAQIDEGILIARKVDALREELTGLQLQHQRFMDGMEGELRQRTSGLLTQIADLDSEVKVLQEKKKTILAPFGGEIEKAIHSQKEFNEMKDELEQVKLSVSEKEESLKVLGRDLKDRLSKIKVRERELERAYTKADEVVLQKEKEMEEFHTLKTSQEHTFEKTAESLKAREASITSFEFSLSERQANIDLQEEEIAKEKVRLLDQRATLERAMARLNK